ncbi:MAG TPA: HlyD family secretion protein [Candidatus Acidoferrum sp.]|jgi:membrane fusion protein (multidrug efflux system)|nr:HlyD family secretion protein [Candidatus Acidoferrum sp.]
MGRRAVIGLAVLVAIGILGWGGWAWYRAGAEVSTDDAYVEGTISPVSAKVAGHIVEQLVRDNQAVRANDIMLRVDPRDYEAKRDQAKAVVAVAEANVRAARAELPLARETTRSQVDEVRAVLEGSRVGVRSSESAVDETRARLESKRAAVAASRADVTAAESAQRKARRDLERMQALMKNDYVSRREFDDAVAALEAADAALEAARRRLNSIEKEVQQTEAEVASRVLGTEQARQRVAEVRGTLARAESQQQTVSVKMAELARAEALLRSAQADLAVAELNLEHCVVRAPIDGVVAKRSVEVGQIVQPGQPLLALVPLDDVWVIANFKETQLTRIRPGQRAEIRVDSFPGAAFVGTVNSISAGTGSRFSLLPPENATGNWVKVVQRVPVKILLDAKAGGNPQPLRAGMSAVVTVRLK